MKDLQITIGTVVNVCKRFDVSIYFSYPIRIKKKKKGISEIIF